MSQPTPYDREYDFSNFQATSPSSPLPAAHVDAEFNRIVTTTDQILANLELIQRDDGALANGIVTMDALDAEVIAGITRAEPWVTATAYTVGDVVIQDGSIYYCATAHTSGTFATDLAASKWTDLGTVASVGVSSFEGRTGDVVATAGDYTAAEVTFTPASTIAAVTVQAAIEEVNTDTIALLAAKQPLDADLTTIAGLTATTNNVIQSVASAWASRTPAQFLATILTSAANDDIIQRKGGVWTNRTLSQLAADLSLGASSTFTNTSAGAAAIAVSLVNNSAVANTETILDLAPNTAGSGVRSAQIASVNEGGGNEASLEFRTANGAAPTTRLTIDKDGAAAFTSTVSSAGVPLARIKTGTYTGDGATSKAITGVGFTPKYVKIWERATATANITYVETTAEILDDNASGGAIIQFDPAIGSPPIFQPDAIIALGSDGFTVDDGGVDDHPNATGVVYNYLCLG